MNDWKVVFCYFDEEKEVISEVLGHIHYPMQREFINELYSMRLDGNYSTKHFFQPGYSTGNLVSMFFPKNGIVDFTPISKIVYNFDVDDRTSRIIESFLEKIEIDDIREFAVKEYDEFIRNSSSPSFLQPDTYQFCVDESKSISANTKAVQISKYDFCLARERQKSGDFKQPKVFFKVS